VGLVSSVNAAINNFTLTTITAAVGGLGIFAIAGYGIASRLDLLPPGRHVGTRPVAEKG
jgi:Na+-driven multidrug efflux pump